MINYETFFESLDELVQFTKENKLNDRITFFDPTVGWILRNERFTRDEDSYENRRIS
jgi:hypothetical protein